VVGDKAPHEEQPLNEVITITYGFFSSLSAAINNGINEVVSTHGDDLDAV
jgi:hypothetical protein